MDLTREGEHVEKKKSGPLRDEWSPRGGSRSEETVRSIPLHGEVIRVL